MKFDKLYIMCVTTVTVQDSSYVCFIVDTYSMSSHILNIPDTACLLKSKRAIFCAFYEFFIYLNSIRWALILTAVRTLFERDYIKKGSNIR